MHMQVHYFVPQLPHVIACYAVYKLRSHCLAPNLLFVRYGIGSCCFDFHPEHLAFANVYFRMKIL